MERDMVGDVAGEFLPDRGSMTLGAYNRTGTAAGATMAGL